jgi:hypothetical protein
MKNDELGILKMTRSKSQIRGLFEGVDLRAKRNLPHCECERPVDLDVDLFS